GDLQQATLRHDRQLDIGVIDQQQPRGRVHGPDFLRKKSRSTVSSPIFSYSLANRASSARALSGAPLLPLTNSEPTPSMTVFFQACIWLAWTPNRLDNSATVPSSLTAASATFALNSGLCFFRVLVMSHLRPNGRSKAGLSGKKLASFRLRPA